MSDQPTDDPRAPILDAYCRLFETLTPDHLEDFRALCRADIRFVDPFNDIVGIDRFVALFAHMFAAVAEPRFVVLDRVLSTQAGYIRWRFTAVARGRPIALEGMSEVRFDPDTALVREHVDHWDAAGQLYAGLPVVGWLVRGLRRLLSAGV